MQSIDIPPLKFRPILKSVIWDDLKNDEITKIRENEKCPLKDLEYGMKTENHGK